MTRKEMKMKKKIEKIINKEIKPGNEEYQQMTLTDILNIGNGEKDG